MSTTNKSPTTSTHYTLEPTPTKRARTTAYDAAFDSASTSNEQANALETQVPQTKNILKFALSDSPVQIQVTSSNTIFDLVKSICEQTTIGMNKLVHCHLWYVDILGKGK